MITLFVLTNYLLEWYVNIKGQFSPNLGAELQFKCIENGLIAQRKKFNLHFKYGKRLVSLTYSYFNIFSANAPFLIGLHARVKST